jgi:DUF4097 and DUF4098 domain-containing protein YvlB
MKKVIFVSVLMALILSSAFSMGTSQIELVNVQEIELRHIDIIKVLYSFENIILYSHNYNTIIIKEYMTENNNNYYAKINSSGNELVVEAGQRPRINLNRFKAYIEVFIPVSNRNITIKTSSGDIKAAGEYTASSMNIESSSGDAEINNIIAETISIKSSSGNIRCNNANGNITVNSSSGTIIVNAVNGDIFAKSSSGKIEIKQISGSIAANATSGNIRSEAVGSNAEIRTTSGSIDFGRVNGNVTAESSSGRIRLALVNGTIDAKASSGDINCAITVNSGNISIETTSGDVTLEIPRNLAFNFSSSSSSGSLRTPFSDRLFRNLSDDKLVLGSIGIDTSQINQIFRNISIETSSGSIRVNWIN